MAFTSKRTCQMRDITAGRARKKGDDMLGWIDDMRAQTKAEAQAAEHGA
jgi:hypothetical protein